MDFFLCFITIKAKYDSIKHENQGLVVISISESQNEVVVSNACRGHIKGKSLHNTFNISFKGQPSFNTFVLSLYLTYYLPYPHNDFNNLRKKYKALTRSQQKISIAPRETYVQDSE